MLAAGCGDGAGGGDGDGDGDGDGTGTDGDACRTYTTVGTFTSAPFSGDLTANFDPDTLIHESTVAGEMGDVVTVSEYGSLEDYVDEAAAVGRMRHTAQSFTSSFVNTESTFEYDSEGRLLSRVVDDLDPSQSDGSTTYTDWDEQGRPTQGTLNVDGIDCTAIPVTIAYDDQMRKMTETVDAVNGTGSSCAGAGTFASWKIYDEDGNVIEETLGGGPDPDVGSTTVVETTQICS
jgi:hypothetical protein